jgi:hypothetical protein
MTMTGVAVCPILPLTVAPDLARLVPGGQDEDSLIFCLTHFLLFVLGICQFPDLELALIASSADLVLCFRNVLYITSKQA